MTDDVSFAEAAEPERLRAFIAALEADGFEHTAPRTWTGSTRQSLLDGGHTTSETMSVIVLPAWPYRAPLLHVPDIKSWHADQERLCIWQAEDNSQRWATVQGMYDRIDEWVVDAANGFANNENARNPEIYWQEDTKGTAAALVDLDSLVGGATADGQHGEFHFAEAVSSDGRRSDAVFDIRPGPFTAMTPRPIWVDDPRLVRGRWYYRTSIPHPPRTLDELVGMLTDKQRVRLTKDLRDRRAVMFGLLWPNKAGVVGTMLLAIRDESRKPDYHLIALRPKGRRALLLRAGPDTEALQTATIAILGVGAIGSHVAEHLARAGTGRLRLIDHDALWPVNLIRHAAPPGTPAGMRKTTALKAHLTQYEWVDIDINDPDKGYVWTIEGLRDVVTNADLTIDATGHAGLAELAARVASAAGRPFVSVALFRAGTVARVRRQADADDTPLLQRPHLDRYPAIPPLPDEEEYVGTETGCLAQVHNAPPTAVIHAAVLAAEVAVDWITGRRDQPDEIIEVLRPGNPPFDRLGRLRADDLPVIVDVTERAHHDLRELARQALPNETGGVLVGCFVDDRPVVTDVVEIRDADATACAYRVPAGKTAEVVAEARARDKRLGYLGDWHSHPSESGPSMLDVATMLATADDSGTSKPLLILVHPNGPTADAVAAYVTSASGLKRADLCPTGELSPEEPST